ncbi:hypothetical protein YC2023_065836 [Brassica napus]
MDDVLYANAVGSLMYAMVRSIPELAFVVGLVSRFKSKPSREHWGAVMWLLRYLHGATEVCLNFSKSGHFEIEGFSDLDYSTDLDKRISVTGYVFQVGGNTVSWRSSLQHVVALSTTEAEYIALSEATKEGLCIQGWFVFEVELQLVLTELELFVLLVRLVEVLEASHEV